MISAANKDLTAALNAYAAGERQGADELMRLVYARLRDMAEEQLRREGPGHTLQPTALVNEAYLRLAAQHTQWRGRSHFFAIAAQAMRRVLIDHARARDSHKRGGGSRPVALSGIDPAAPRSEVDLLALGTRGRTGLLYAYLGSVAGDLLRSVECDVLVVPRRVGSSK